MLLYHVGFSEIQHPDVHFGRSNADFGPGFYTSPDKSFSEKWGKKRRGEKTILNTYELDEANLKIKRFERDKEWFDYIFSNRNFKEDKFKDYDVIIGPIANDTIYDTWGVLTSGLVNSEKALEVLQAGPCYEQVNIKSEKAASNLKFLSSLIIPEDALIQYRSLVREEEIKYQDILVTILDDVIDK